MTIFYQYNEDGLINAIVHVKGEGTPDIVNQFESEEDLLGKIYDDGKVYEPVLDENLVRTKTNGNYDKGDEVSI